MVSELRNITVERIHEDGLTKEEWGFWYDDWKHALTLNLYRLSTRSTRRHGWRSERSYSRLDNRGHSIKTAMDVPFPTDVGEDARQQFFDKLRVLQVQER